MRLQLIPPRVEPSQMSLPYICRYDDFQDRHFGHHQEVDRPVKDTQYDSVCAQRYEYLRCKRTFRLYPSRVTRAQTSQRVKALALMLHSLGLSNVAVSVSLEAQAATESLNPPQIPARWQEAGVGAQVNIPPSECPQKTNRGFALGEG